MSKVLWYISAQNLGGLARCWNEDMQRSACGVILEPPLLHVIKASADKYCRRCR